MFLAIINIKGAMKMKSKNNVVNLGFINKKWENCEKDTNLIKQSSLKSYVLGRYAQPALCHPEQCFLPLRCRVGERGQSGFTLAEVLITIGIIGVVSALTIPNLITNYKAKQLRSQFLKSYSLVQQAFKQMEADDVSLNPQDYVPPEHEQFYLTFMKYFNGAMTCGTNAHGKNTPCYDSSLSTTADGYKSYDGSVKIYDILDDGQFVLPDGTNIMLENSRRPYILVSVDLNGYGNPPNRLGYDLFTFEFSDGELKTMGDKGTSFTDERKYCNKNSNESYNGITCAHLAKTNSDYFKEIVRNFR